MGCASSKEVNPEKVAPPASPAPSRPESKMSRHSCVKQDKSRESEAASHLGDKTIDNLDEIETS